MSDEQDLKLYKESKSVGLDYVEKQIITQKVLSVMKDTEFFQKLQMFQAIKGIPELKGLIKERKVGSTNVKYVPIRFMERILNFIFHFKWKREVIDKGIRSYETKTNAGKQTVVWEARVLCRFYYFIDDTEYSKDSFGSRQIYENKGTTNYVVFGSALSQATKNFGQVLGIGSDLNEDFEEDRFEIVQEVDIDKATENFGQTTAKEDK